MLPAFDFTGAQRSVFERGLFNFSSKQGIRHPPSRLTRWILVTRDCSTATVQGAYQNTHR